MRAYMCDLWESGFLRQLIRYLEYQTWNSNEEKFSQALECWNTGFKNEILFIFDMIIGVSGSVWHMIMALY